MGNVRGGRGRASSGLKRYTESLETVGQRGIGRQGGVRIARSNRNRIVGAEYVPVGVHGIYSHVESRACGLGRRRSSLAVGCSGRGSFTRRQHLQFSQGTGV